MMFDAKSLAGCAAAFTFAALAVLPARADDATILASCKADLQFSDSACACVLDKVHETLNEKQLAFFVAALKKDTQAQMKALQKKLTADGFDVGEIDGILGAGTRDAVRQEQKRLGLPADGWPTVKLLNAF